MSAIDISDLSSCPVLQQRSKGHWVVRLQKALNDLGYGPLDIDGNFGQQTTDAVKKFQQNHGLDADGVVGPQTWAAIAKQIASQSGEPSSPVTNKQDDKSLGQINQAILKAALNLKGMSTADGPDDGNNACAWAINRVLQEAGIPSLGENPNLVSSLVDALQGVRGQRISTAEAIAGDLVVAYGENHIGVGLNDGCTRVLSNSSSRARFIWESNKDFDGSYGGPSTIYRLLK